MAIEAAVSLHIPFHDIDVMYIAWHGHYLKYFELARTRLMQSLSLDWPRLQELGVAMPIVRAELDFRQALAYDEHVKVEAAIKEYQYAALEIHYRIVSPAPEAAKVFATGFTKQVYMDIKTRQLLFEVPRSILSRFEQPALPLA